MANREETYSPNYHSVFVESNLDTRVVILAHNHETISDFKDKFYREHKECYPEIGEINISSLKVKCRGNFFRLPDSVNMNKVFEGCTSKNWFLYADLARVEKGGEFMAIMAADQTEIASDSAVLVDEHNKGLTLGESLETKVVENKTKKRKMESLADKKSRKKSKINLDQSAVATTSSGDVVDESHELGGKVQLEDDILAGALFKDIENGEKNGISMGENQQSSDADMLCQEKSITNNSELVEGYTRDEAKDVQASQTLKEVPSEKIDDLTGATFENTGNVDRVDATFESLAVSERGNIGNPLGQAIQKENEMGEKIDDDVGIGRAISSAADYIQTDNIVSYPENQLGVSSGLTTGTATEKKKRPKKSSKGHINQSTTTTISREIVNERDKLSGSIDHVDATSEVFPDLRGEKPVTLVETIQNENEMGYKFVDKVGSIGTTPNGADEIQAEENVQAADLATTLPALVQESKTLDHIGEFTDDKRTAEHDIAKDNGEIGADEAKSVKSTKKKKSRKTKIPNGADEIQAEDNVQVADLATTLPALVQESKTVDHIGKFTDDKRTAEHEVAKDNGEIDADEAKTVKSTKKKKSRKAQTSAIEDTLVDSGPQNVEPFKVVDGEGPDNVIRNVLNSLHQRNETQESLDKTEKKASKRSKKRLSSNIVESQVLPVEVNNAQEAAPEGTDASWMSVKKDTESNASRLKKRIKVADKNEDNNLSQQTQKEKANMADNFGSRQKDDTVVGGKKQDKVTGGAKSKKEKKSLDLHPGGSIDGSLTSMKPKERSSKVQPASSGTSHLKSTLKNDRSGSKVDDSITSVKKSSNALTVNKSKLNFFKDAEWNSLEDEHKRTSPHVSTKTPPDSSSDDDSDVTSTSRKQGNNQAGVTDKFTGRSLQDILRSSRSYKKAKETASQYMSDDESPAIDIVPDSQAN